MNSTDANRTIYDAPNASVPPMQDNGFRVIMELTTEEKRELIALWREFHEKHGE